MVLGGRVRARTGARPRVEQMLKTQLAAAAPRLRAPAKPDSLRRRSADKSQTKRIGRPPKANWVGGWLRAGLGFVPGSGLVGAGPNPACFAAYPL